MQQIVPCRYLPETYVSEGVHQRIRSPESCPRCGQSACLNVHGYYERNATDSSGHELRMKVRRFICKACEVTVSCLPYFLQPYRLVNTATLEAYLMGDLYRMDVQRHVALLGAYQRGLQNSYEQVRQRLGNLFGRAPPQETVTAFWRRAVTVSGTLADLTGRLVNEFRTTCFGSYRCHQPHAS